MKPDEICINEQSKSIFVGYPVISLVSDGQTKLNLETPMKNNYCSILQRAQKSNGLQKCSKVNIKFYLDQIIDTAIKSYASDDITIINNIECLDVDRALSIILGNIVEEMVVNAIKHGFNKLQKPILNVSFKENFKNCSYILKMNNNGNSFPERLSVDESSAKWLKMIQETVAMLDGEVKLTRLPYLMYTIEIPYSCVLFEN